MADHKTDLKPGIDGSVLGINLTMEQSGVKVADIIELQSTTEEDRKVLWKIDTQYDTLVLILKHQLML